MRLKRTFVVIVVVTNGLEPTTDPFLAQTRVLSHRASFGGTGVNSEVLLSKRRAEVPNYRLSVFLLYSV